MENDLSKPQRRIYLFGALQIQDEGGARPLTGEKVQSLLAYLALNPRLLHSRERLADLLSPEDPPERVRKNFSSNLYRLKKNLGPGWLYLQGNIIALRVDPGLWVDVWEFERLAASDRETDLQKAVDLYTGDLLPEIYADWVLAERELRRSQYLSALEKLATYQEKRGELQEALLSLRRLILAEPLHEPAHQAYLRLLGRLRRYGEALTHYDYLYQLLQSELGAEPLAETQEIMQAIERERDLAAKPVAAAEEMAFVGRVSERARGMLAVEAATNRRGGILAIEGEAGIGKSRLLQEILNGAHWRGAIVLQGGASEIPGGSPFAPLAEALSPMLHGPRGAQLESLLPPEILSALSPIYSAWGERAELHHATFEQGGKQFDRALSVFSERLAQLGPVILALDDMQWASDALWKSLEVFARSFTKQGALILLSYRRPEILQTSGWDMLQSWDRAGLIQTIVLQPLSVDEVAQLVQYHVDADPNVIHAITGGNPFLIGEWLNAITGKGSQENFGPGRRFRELSGPDRSALECAAILGENLPYRLWMEMSGNPPLSMVSIAERLVEGRWIQPSTVGYRFTHDLVRSTVYAEIDGARRRQLHERASRAYRVVESANSLARAFHLEQAGLLADASVAYRTAGEQDLKRFAFREAQAALDKAMMLSSRNLTRERIETALALARACEVTGDRVRQKAVLDEALIGAQQMEDTSLILRTLLVMGGAASRTNRIQEAHTLLGESLRLAREIQDRQNEFEVNFLLGNLAGQQGKWDESQSYYSRANQLAQSLSDLSGESRALGGLAIAAWQKGRSQEAARWLEQALVVQRKIGDRLSESTTLTNLLGAYNNISAWDRLFRTAKEALPLLEAVGNRPNMGIDWYMQGLAFYALGDYVNARQMVSQAEQLLESTGNRRTAGIARNVLGLIAEAEGDDEEALHLYQTALSGSLSLNAATEAAFARHDLGVLLFRLGRVNEAVAILKESRAAWRELGNDFFRLKSEAFLGLGLLAAGEQEPAMELALAGWTAFQSGVPLEEQYQGWLWALYRLLVGVGRADQAFEVLGAAYEELQRQAREISDPEMRRSFFEKVALNHSIVEEYQRTAKPLQVITVSLARREAPLGRPLKPDEYIEVQWTISAPEDEAVLNKAQRRRLRLKRLLVEAESQGAAPTDGDLARALEVSRRTILRDLQALEEDIQKPATRKRKPS